MTTAKLFEQINKKGRFDLKNEEERLIKMVKPIVHNGLLYSNLTELANKHNINPKTLKYRLDQGMNLDEALSSKRKQRGNKNNHIEFKGVVYPSYKALAKDVDMNYELLISRLNAGYSLEDSIEGNLKRNLKKNLIEYNGEIYESYIELSKKLGVNYKLLMRRLNKGLTLEDALTKKLNKGQEITYNGVTYSSIRELCKEYSVNAKTFYTRKRKGLSIHECIYGKNSNK